MHAVKLTLSPDCQGAKVCDTCGLMTQYVYALAARTERSSTQCDAGKPARNADAEFLVLLPEFSAQCRLFIKKDKSKKCQPNNETILQRGDVAEEHPLTKDLR